MAGNAPRRASEIIRLDNARAAKILLGVPFIEKLAGQDEGLLSRLAAVCVFKKEVAGTVIFRQGDPGKYCYIVTQGEVAVLLWKGRSGDSKSLPTPRLRFDPEHFHFLEEFQHKLEEEAGDFSNKSGSQAYRFRSSEGFSTFTDHSSVGEHILTLGAGSLFGELALMNNAPRATTIRCLQDCEFLIIPKEDYHAVQHDILQASEAQVIDDFCTVLGQLCGSVVRAWRTVLDPGALGELLFSEFVEALTRLNWNGNTSALWGALVRRAHANNRDVVVGLAEIAPEEDRIIERFKFWMESKFGGAIEMFNDLTGNRPNASLSYADFMRVASPYGSPRDLELVWQFLDAYDSGAISLKDMAFMEINGLKRKAALDPSFVLALEAAKSAALSLRKRARMQKRAQDEALMEFIRRIRAASGGSFIRGYRKILDRNGNLAISKVEMLKGCRQVAYGGDVMALWKAMDQDGDGAVHLPELDVRYALVLASFKKWSTDSHGNCVKAMQHLAAIARRRTAKWNVDDFVAALNLSRWPGVAGMSLKLATSMLHEAADLTGTRTITAQDLAFLDHWEPIPWLCAEPDYEGKDHLIATLRARYVNLIVAWRRLFDRNNKNHVTYKEFSQACVHIQIKNAPGIWRALDVEHSGFISLKHIDNESAQVLVNFKEWAEETFGTMQFAFKVLAAPNSNAVSLPVFKRVLSEFGFQGDARVLFQSLKPDAGNRHNSRDARLRYDDMKHLSSWETDTAALDDDELYASEDEQAAAAGRSASDDAPLSLSLPRGERPLAEESSIVSAGTLPTCTASRGIGSSRGYSSMSDFFHYCKGAKEHEIFTLVRDDHMEKHDKYKTFRLSDVLRQELKDSCRSKGPISPYRVPVVCTGTGGIESARSIGSRQQKLASSMSLPCLSNARGVSTPDRRTANDPKKHELPMLSGEHASADAVASSTGFTPSAPSELPALVARVG